MAYFRGQGKVLMAERDANGNPGVFRHVGNVPSLEVNLESDIEEHKESETGQGLTDFRLLKGTSSKGKFVMEDFTEANLTDAMYGESSVIASGTVSLEGAPAGVAAGDIVRLSKPNVSSVVVKDSNATPAPLALGVNYEVFSPEHGSIKFLNVDSFTQPFTFDYSNAQAVNINMLTQGIAERWLRFEGFNTADGNRRILIELYRFSYDPVKTLSLITDSLQGFELEGGVLYDATKAVDPVLGQFGRVVLL